MTEDEEKLNKRLEDKKRLNKKLVEIVRDEKLSSAVRLKKAKYLVALGADVNARVKGKSLLVLAKEADDAGLIEFLEQKGGKEWELSKEEKEKLNKRMFDAVQRHNKFEVVKCIEEGGDVNVIRGGGSMLMMAVMSKDLEMAKVLMENGCDVNEGGKKYFSNLRSPIVNHDVEMVKALIDGKADLNVDMGRGYTLLMTAIDVGTPEIVELLVEKGADVNQKDDDGRTALMRASLMGNVEAVKVLLHKNADVFAKDNSLKSAISYAQENKHVEIEEMLKRVKSENKKTTIEGLVNKIFGRKGR